MRKIILAVALAATMAMTGGCATTGASGSIDAAVSIARTGVDATAHAFDAALYGLDFAMDAKLLTPGSDQAKRIAGIGREVQHYLNVADAELKGGDLDGAKAALDHAAQMIEQFKALLPAASRTVGLASPPRAPLDRPGVLARAAG